MDSVVVALSQYSLVKYLNLIMGACSSNQEAVENRKIDEKQREAAKKQEQVISLLLLGTGDSGKTTLRKQITNIHNHSFQAPERRCKFKQTIFNNIVEGVLSMLELLDDKKWKKISQEITEQADISEQYFTEKLASIISNLIFKDEEFSKKLPELLIETHAPESFMVFLQRLQKYPSWGGIDWVPSADDCIRCRLRTSGIHEESFSVDGVQFKIFDVGGQRAERRKWLHVFQTVTAILYVASLGDYDQVLFEDKNKNRLKEAMDLFSECSKSVWLSKTPILLFLNKRDVFERKLIEEKIPLNISGSFPNAPKTNDVSTALNWISQEFLTRRGEYHSESPAKSFLHVTTATDMDNVQKVFDDCRRIILEQNINRILG